MFLAWSLGTEKRDTRCPCANADCHRQSMHTGHATVLKAIQQASSLLEPDPLSAFSSETATTTPRHLRSLKLNVVVINNLNSDEVLDFVELTKNTDISVRFIEYMPFDGNKWSTKKLVPSADLLDQISQHYTAAHTYDGPAAGPSSPSSSWTNGPGLHLQNQPRIVALRPGNSDTARIYTIEGYKGSFGFISSMTDNFCSGCSRLRLGTDGSMKVRMGLKIVVYRSARKKLRRFLLPPPPPFLVLP